MSHRSSRAVKGKYPTLKPGLYSAHGTIGFLGYQTQAMAYLIELENKSGNAYCCSKGNRHPAAGKLLRKSTLKRLSRDEISPAMVSKWTKRQREACRFVGSCLCHCQKNNTLCDCKTLPVDQVPHLKKKS